jgi:hypothetical protein
LTATGKYTLGSNASGTATLSLAGASVSPDANTNSGAVNGCFQVRPAARTALTLFGSQGRDICLNSSYMSEAVRTATMIAIETIQRAVAESFGMPFDEL